MAKKKRKQPIQLRRYQAQRKKARVFIKPNSKTKFRRVPKMIIRPQYTLEELRAIIDTQKSTREGVLDGIRETMDNDRIVNEEMRTYNKDPQDL